MKKISLGAPLLALVCSVVVPVSAGVVHNVLLVSTQDEAATDAAYLSGWGAAEGITENVTVTSDINAQSLAGYDGIWGAWESGIGFNPSLAAWVAAGGSLFVETPGNDLANLPDGNQLVTTGGFGDSVQIVAPTNPLMVGFTDATFSGWSSSYHDDYSSVGSFTVLSVAADDGNNALTVTEQFGLGRITYTGQDFSFHVVNGNGQTGELSDKIQFVDRALDTAAVPEPGSLTLFGLALASFGVFAWRKRKSNA